jgi:hypothetical protein
MALYHVVLIHRTEPLVIEADEYRQVGHAGITLQKMPGVPSNHALEFLTAGEVVATVGPGWQAVTDVSAVRLLTGVLFGDDGEYRYTESRPITTPHKFG